MQKKILYNLDARLRHIEKKSYDYCIFLPGKAVTGVKEEK